METALGALSLGLAAVLLVGGLFRPGWAFAAIMLLFPLEQVIQTFLPFFVSYGQFLNYAVGITAVSSLITAAMRGRPVIRGYLNIPALGAILLYALACTSLMWSPQLYPVKEVLLFNMPPVILAIVFSPMILNKLDDVRDFCRAFLFIGTIMAILVMVNPNRLNVWGRLKLDLGGVESNPLALSDLGGSLIIMGAFLYPKGTASVMFWGFVRGSAIFFGSALLFASSSRGQAIAAGVVVFLLWPLARRIKSVGSFIGTGLAAGLLLGVASIGLQAFLLSGTEKRWSSERIGNDLLGRLDAVVNLLRALAKSPSGWIVGLGSGAYETIDSSLPYVHNTPVECLGELGIVGFTLYVAVFIGGWYALYRYWNMWKIDPATRWVAALLVAMAGYFFIISLKQGHLWGDYKFLMFCILGARLAIIDAPDEEYLEALESEATENEDASFDQDSLDSPEAGEHLKARS